MNTHQQAAGSNLMRWSGVAAMLAGILFVVVGLIHPPATLASVTRPQWAIAHGLATAMCFLALPGLMGMHARQAEQSGWLGLAGFVLYSLSWLLTAPFTFAEAFLLPLLAPKSAGFVAGFLGVFSSAGTPGFEMLTRLWALTGLLYMAGGALFGVATFRAGVLSRWAAILLVAASALAPVAALLPPELQPKVAVPAGAALAWLGYALWSERRDHAAARLPGRASPSTTNMV